MKILSRMALIVSVLAVSLAAYAQSPVGKWSGKLDVSAVKPKNATEKQQIDAMKKMFAGPFISLELRANKTYTVTFSAPGGQKPSSESGKWSQSGRTISVTGKKKTEKMTISADGKQMIMLPPADDKSSPKGMKVVFTRG